MIRTISYSFTYLFCISLFFFSSGCTKSKSIARLDLSAITITPVTTPTVYRYGPCVGQFKMEITKDITNKRESQTLFIKYSVIQDGHSLIWHMFVPKWIENGKKFSPRMPLIDATLDTDLRGVTGKASVTFPLIETLPKTARDKLADDLQKTREQLTSLSSPLPEQAIVSGDAIRQTPLSDPPDGTTVDSADVSLILDGEFIYNGVTYVSASMKEEIPITETKTGATAFLNLSGFTIMQKDNMDTVRGEFSVILYDGLGKNHGTLNVLITRLQE